MHSNHQISPESCPDGKGFTKKLMEYLNITYVMLWAICCHLNKSKNVKNSHGEELLLVKLQASAYNFNKNITPPWVFSCFLSCPKCYQIQQSFSYRQSNMQNKFGWKNKVKNYPTGLNSFTKHSFLRIFSVLLLLLLLFWAYMKCNLRLWKSSNSWKCN